MEGLAPSYLWLIFAAVFLALEAFGLPGIGLFFAGIAALITGLLVEYGAIAGDDYILQFGSFLVLTAVTAGLLWKQMQRWRTNPKADGEFNNMVGSEATVLEGGLHKGKRGKAKWSGTIMSAELSADAAIDTVEEGTIVQILAVKGTCLIVAPC